MHVCPVGYALRTLEGLCWMDTYAQCACVMLACGIVVCACACVYVGVGVGALHTMAAAALAGCIGSVNVWLTCPVSSVGRARDS